MTSQAGKGAFARRIGRLLPRLANPVVVKEVRGQMRGPRAFVVLTAYLAALGLVAYGLYRVILIGMVNWYGSMGGQSAYVGQALFILMSFLELLFVCFVTPALTAGSISGEHERRTFDMLLATRLRPAAILWGKTLPALLYVLLVILAAIPLSSIVFLFGGVALRDMLQTVGLMVLVAVTYGMIGVFFSALTRRTGQAMALSYAVVVLLVAGTMVAWVASRVITQSSGQPAQPLVLLYLNPLSALTSAIIPPEAPGMIFGIVPYMDSLFYMGGGQEIIGAGGLQLASRPLWQYTAAAYLALTIVLYLVTAQLIRPVRRWRVGWRTWAAVLAALLVLGAGLVLVFGTHWGSTGWSQFVTPTPALVQFDAPGKVLIVPPQPLEAPVQEAPASASAEAALATPQPVPTPPAAPNAAAANAELDPDAYAPALGEFAATSGMPLSGTGLCEVDVLASQTGDGEKVQVFAWLYCRAFERLGGQLVAGMGYSGPARFELTPEPGGGWEVTGLAMGATSEVLPPEAQQRLLAAPYDELAGEARLRERAEQSLLTPPQTGLEQ